MAIGDEGQPSASFCIFRGVKIKHFGPRRGLNCAFLAFWAFWAIIHSFTEEDLGCA